MRFRGLRIGLSIFLLLAAFLAGSIILFGLISVKSNLIILYFTFVLSVILVFVYSSRERFNKKDVGFVLIAAILIAGFAAYSAEAGKTYFDRNYQFAANNSELLYQIDSLTQTNQDSLVYIDYLREQIILVHSDSLQLQKAIDSIKASTSQQTTDNATVNQAPVIILHREEEDEND